MSTPARKWSRVASVRAAIAVAEEGVRRMRLVEKSLTSGHLDTIELAAAEGAAGRVVEYLGDVRKVRS